MRTIFSSLAAMIAAISAVSFGSAANAHEWGNRWPAPRYYAVPSPGIVVVMPGEVMVGGPVAQYAPPPGGTVYQQYTVPCNQHVPGTMIWSQGQWVRTSSGYDTYYDADGVCRTHFRP